MKVAIFSTSIAGHAKSSPLRIRYNTAFYMAEKGHDVTFITPGEGGLLSKKKTVNSSFKCIYTPGIMPAKARRGGFSFLDMVFKTYHVLRNPYDAIQVTGGHRPANFIPCFLAKRLRRTIIVDECWEWLGKGGYADAPRKGIMALVKARYDGKFDAKLNASFDDIIVISTALKSRYNDKSKVHVLHGGAETDNLIDYPINSARKILNIDQDLFLIGMSNLVPMDHDANKKLFESLQDLTKQHKNLKLIVTGPDGLYIQNIENKYHLDGHLIYPGWITFHEYNLFMSSCNLFILPFPDNTINRARWPNKISDYLCLNRPIISNPTGDLPYYFNRYQIGLLCNNHPEDYKGAVNVMIEKKDKLKFVCRDSQKVAIAELSFKGRVDKILEIFKNRSKARQREKNICIH